MDTPSTKLASARSFVRSLNILLKFARLYGFDHARTMEQFNTAWNELHASLPVTSEAGLLLGATGAQLLLDGVPVEASPAERSFAQLLSAAGLASIQFASRVTKEDFERFVRAFPTQNTKPSVLAEQLKSALANAPNIRINEIRFVAEDSSKSDALAASLLTAQTLGADTESVKDWLTDPQKLIQLIAAAEGSRGEYSEGGEGPGDETGTNAPEGTAGAPATDHLASGTGSGNAGSSPSAGTNAASSGTRAASGGPGAAAGAGGAKSGGKASASTGHSTYSSASLSDELLHYGTEVGPAGTGGPRRGGPGGLGPGGAGSGPGRPRKPGDTGSGVGGWTSKDEDILGILKLLTSLGQNIAGGPGGTMPMGPLQEELTKLPAESQETLRKALAAVAAQAPPTKANDPMLLRLAEHLAIKFALERYERGEVKVNAVRTLIEKMSLEIDGLRKILGVHEQKLADAGVIVESSADMLDQQFWRSVPERGKVGVLTSSDAWCIPARNIKQYVEELIQRGDEKTALAILMNYASCLQSTEFEGRRRTAIGLVELADEYAAIRGEAMAPALRIAGAQLGVERDDDLQGLISAAFVRLAQEAGLKRLFPALIQTLDSIDAVENQRPVFGQSMRPRIGLEKRVPEFLDEVLRSGRTPDGLSALLQRVPKTTADSFVARFNRTATREEMQRLVDLARSTGDELLASLRDALRSATPHEAAETAALLSRLDPSVIERWLPERIAQWPRQAQDRAVRLVAMGGAEERGKLLANLISLVDGVLLSLVVDEIGLSGDPACVAAVLNLAETGAGAGKPAAPYVRLKAVENLGRLHAKEAVDLLRGIAEERHMLRWANAAELRVAAVQSLAKINPSWARDFAPRSGLTAPELSLAPLDPLANAKYFRRRRYPRVRLAQPVPATATVGQDTYKLEVRGLSLSGGIAAGEKHLPPGTLVSLKIGAGLRPIRAQVLMRDARAQGLGFEIVDMDLDERSRLRKLLLENKPSISSHEDGVLAQTSA